MKSSIPPRLASSVRRLPRNLLPPILTKASESIVTCRRWGHTPLHPIRASHALRESRLDLLPTSLAIPGGLIVDVGANVGDWTANILQVMPRAEVIAVEPSPLHRSLNERFADRENVQVIHAAVADADGTAELFLTEHSHNNSLLKPRDMNDFYGGGWSPIATTKVPTRTLDSIVGDRPVFLVKIDVQGSESAVLAGAHRTLERAAVVLLELTTLSHYEGDSTLGELHKIMEMHHYFLAGISKPRVDSRGRILWLDGCYVNERAFAT